MKYSRCDEYSPRVPRPAFSPPPDCGGLSCAVRRAALHPRSTLPPPRRSGPYLQPSLRSDVDLLCPLSALPLATVQAFTTFARRPRSRLGIPVRLRRSGGRHRFRRSSSPPVQARRSAATFPVSSAPSVHPCPENGGTKCFYPFTGVNRPLHPSFTSFGRGSAVSVKNTVTLTKVSWRRHSFCSSLVRRKAISS